VKIFGLLKGVAVRKLQWIVIM